MAPLPRPESKTVAAIYAWHEREAEDRESIGLGLSAVGNPCDRALWYAFRWASRRKVFDGRMLRLFETGHAQEARMLDELRAIGCEVLDRDPETGRQWRVRVLADHLRGYLDAKALGILEAPGTWHVVECKTMADKPFRALTAKGVQVARPDHYDQVQGYMHLSEPRLERALYLAVNKNTDELYSERIRRDPEHCDRMLARLERIIYAPKPPPKLHEDPESRAAFVCRFCDHREICHGGRLARLSCRTCLHATPCSVGKATWTCSRHQMGPDLERQKTGCAYHLFIPDLVPGEQVDADVERETVTYEMADGSTWINGAERREEGA